MRKMLAVVFAASTLFSITSTVMAACPVLRLGTSPSGQSRPVTAMDIATLRDIGPVGVGRADLELLTISPDEKWLAFQLRRADPASNRYCLAIMVVPATGKGLARVLDEGGDFIKAKTAGEGFQPREAGFAEVITPRWSADSRSLYFLRRDTGRTRIWRAYLNGRPAEPVSSGDLDIEAFDLSEDGQRLLVRLSPSDEGARPGEGETGYLFDDRFNPAVSNRPLARVPTPVQILSLTLDGGDRRDPTTSERMGTIFEPQRPSLSGGRHVVSSRGDGAWIAPNAEGDLTSPRRIEASIKGVKVRCEACDWAYGLWWSDDGKDVIYFHRPKASLGMSLYRWRLSEIEPRRVFNGNDAWVGCAQVGARLVCAREAADRPRTLAAIDLTSGQVQTLFDPNPDFMNLSLGRARPLRWSNAFGLETAGMLVLPPDYRGEKRLPLVVVGYDARGFLRGGTGDEYPIHALASEGFAVLVYSRPPLFGAVNGARTPLEVTQFGHRDWSDYKNVLSSIEMGVKLLVDDGIVDPKRVGLTGFSNGASVAQYALVNQAGFAAYALSHCCEDPVASLVTTGPVVNRWLRRIGYPGVTDTAEKWTEMSIRQNIERIDVPILLQLSDDEYLGALEALGAFAEREKPVETYIFAGEHHVKWQPAHRVAIYKRSIEWFRFWLKDEEPLSPDRKDALDRWRALKAARATPMSPNLIH